MRLSAVSMGLLSVVLVSIIGCATATHVARSRQVSMVTAIKNNQAQQTRRLNQEGIVAAIVKDSSAIAEFVPGGICIGYVWPYSSNQANLMAEPFVN